MPANSDPNNRPNPYIVLVVYCLFTCYILHPISLGATAVAKSWLVKYILSQ